MKKILSLLMLALISVGTAWAADVTLFQTDFSSSDWSAYTADNPITAKSTVNGIYFHCADYVANDALYFNGGGNYDASKRYCAIHVTGVNKSVTIVINNNKSARVIYSIKEETSITSAGEKVDPKASSTTTINYNMTGDGDELTFYFYQQGGSVPNIVKDITITTPDASTVTTIELSEVTVNGEAIGNLSDLLTAKSLTLDDAYTGIPTVKYTVKTTVTEGDADPTVTTQLVSATLVKGDGQYTTTLTAGVNSYVLAFTDVTEVDLLDLTDETEATVVLSRDNIVSFGYLATTTQNWNEGKTYGDYSGDFYNMSSTDRKITIKVKGATSFEVFVQNTNAGRGYSVQVGEGEAQTVNHGAKGVESSGAIELTGDETTITIAGTGNSVYPVYVVFKNGPADEPAEEDGLTIKDTDVTDGTYYYKLYVSSEAADYSFAYGEDGNSYGTDDYADDHEGFQAFIVTEVGDIDIYGSDAPTVTLTPVGFVPANTPVVVRAKKPQAYEVYRFSMNDQDDVTANLLKVANAATTIDGIDAYGAVLEATDGNVYFGVGTTAVAAGKVYLGLTAAQYDGLKEYLDYVELYKEYGWSMDYPTLAIAGASEEAETAANIAELLTKTGTVNLTLTNTVVSYAGGEYVNIEDASAGLRLQSEELASALTTGNILNGTIELKVSSTFGSTVVSTTDNTLSSPITVTEGDAPVAIVIDEDTEIDEDATDPLEPYYNRLVKFNGIKLTTIEDYGTYQALDLGDLGFDNYVIENDFVLLGAKKYYDNLGVEYGTPVDVTGFIFTSFGQPLFQPTAITTPVTIGEAGVATFSSANRLDFSASEKIAAYIATVEGTTVTFKQVKQVPANTGVLLRSVDGGAVTEDISVVVATPDDTKGNALVASDGSSVEGKYILANGANGIGFYKAGATNTLAAGKAYLDVASTARFIGLDGQTTGISSVETAGEAQAVYNLQGQRVVKAVKGLNIIGGKKVLVK